MTEYRKAGSKFTASHRQVYKREVAVIKKYGNMYKLTCHKVLREAGWEQVDGLEECKVNKNTEKLSNNISRAKSSIFEIAQCNDWDYFITCTLDSQKYDRTDLGKYRKDLAQFIRDQRKKYQCDIRYLLIPELHSDCKSWHMHGLLGGIKDEMLEEFDCNAPYKLRALGYKNYPDYARRFGFVSLGIINCKEAIAKYITKYVCKDIKKSVTELGKHTYFCSRGLNRAVKIKQGLLRVQPTQWDYENEYVKIAWISKDDIDKYII